MKILWTEPAITDLENIKLYIARDSERYASIFVEKIIRSAENIEFFPSIGRIIPEVDDPKLRELLIHPYRLIYKNSDDVVEILAIIHQARDFSKI